MKNILKALTLFLLIFSEGYGDENLSNEILKNLRCLVCQGQSISDSNSDFAQTVKLVVNDLIEEGKSIDQETRLFDIKKNETRSMRSKEDAHDYRYFPDPDLLPLEVTDKFIDDIRS